MRRFVAAVVAVAVVATAAGCSQVGSRSDAAASVAVRFHHAVAAGDGKAACSLLTPSTADAVVADDGKPCAAAILSADVPSADAVRTVQVWGLAAQVTMAGDVVFLAVNDGRWTVRAAGCTPRGEQPYQCQIQGN